MQILITFLTVVLVLNCLLLVLLVLIQLPKKEAGAGLAFGGGATDALFGAGSGNALTKLTKYASASFLLLSVVLGVMNSNAAHSSGSRLRQELGKQRTATPIPAAAPAAAATASPFEILNTNSLSAPALTTTNIAPAATATKAPATANTNAAAPK